MANDRRRSDRVALAGLAGCAVALVGAAWLPAPAWRAWLAAAFLCTASPIGALLLLMVMRLTPGDWSEELGPFMEASALLLPLAALLLVPVLVASSVIYPWAGEPMRTEFRAAWLSTAFFMVRTAAWFALLLVLAFLLVVRRVKAPAAACIGLVLVTVAGTVIAVDWLLSLDPDFASSGFGLYVLGIQALTALAVALGGLILSDRGVRRPGLLAAMLLTLLLVWAYLAFVHFVIPWSTNLPPGVLWYQRRTSGGWDLVMWAVAASRLIPLFLLLFRTFRNSPRRLLALSGVIVAGTVLESAWLVFPAGRGEPQAGAADFGLYLLASAAMAGLLAGMAPRALDWRDRRLTA
jgi:hypothetical protein